jgi:hypothetical protein
LDARASGTTTISDVQVSNVRATSFTVSWITDGEVTGRIVYASAPTTLTETAYDVRGPSFEDDTHYVTVAQLADETSFYFDVVSGAITDNNGGAHYQVTTGPVLGPTSSHTVYGQVFKSDGSTTASGAIVYITLADNDGSGSAGQAAPMSALSGYGGYWNANLGNARTQTLGAYFTYSASGDELQLGAQGAGDGQGTLEVDTLHTAPAPDILLSSTRVDVYLPLVLSDQGSASGDTSGSSSQVRPLGPLNLRGGRARSGAWPGDVGARQ